VGYNSVLVAQYNSPFFNAAATTVPLLLFHVSQMQLRGPDLSLRPVHDCVRQCHVDTKENIREESEREFYNLGPTDKSIRNVKLQKIFMCNAY
jgi:hypothetical protein